ncbi:tetra-peptide repeat homeobox protein 1-like [Canis lupus dingo]|uniref:tetra-peptide repeat homeobox protein 1-like n=1 Tax=Canis lupus dingo TaxID=286419 RepID=UPI0020C333E8|nr:tetra-peptide repeat homeobox protein 1-like [Canis lupus dingo]
MPENQCPYSRGKCLDPMIPHNHHRGNAQEPLGGPSKGHPPGVSSVPAPTPAFQRPSKSPSWGPGHGPALGATGTPTPGFGVEPPHQGRAGHHSSVAPNPNPLGVEDSALSASGTGPASLPQPGPVCCLLPAGPPGIMQARATPNLPQISSLGGPGMQAGWTQDLALPLPPATAPGGGASIHPCRRASPPPWGHQAGEGPRSLQLPGALRQRQGTPQGSFHCTHLWGLFDKEHCTVLLR